MTLVLAFKARPALIVEIAAVAVLAGASAAARAGDPVESYVNAVSPLDRSEAEQRLFAAASLGRLRELKAHPHDSVAVRAAWETVSRAADRDPNKDGEFVGRAEMQRFLGFVEGRLDIVLSESLEATLLKARHSNGVYFSPEKFYPTERTAAGPTTARGTGAVKDESADTLVLTKGGRSLGVPSDVLGDDLKAGLLFDISGENAFVATYSSPCMGYDLKCVSVGSGETRWTAPVRAQTLGIPPSQGFHVATAQTAGRVVYVVGVCNDAFYVEGFAIEDGRPVMRFSTQP